jgi:peptide deformylase
MILPITAYGDPVLRKVAKEIDPAEIDINTLSANMFETMYAASGVGLAGPQVGQSLRIFVVDGTPANRSDETDDDPDEEPDLSLVDFKHTFINPTILSRSTGDEWAFEEGCLSIPGIRSDVYRPETVTIRYRDLAWQEHTETYAGMAARIIQHEYDHLQGKLFTDYMTPLRRQLLKKKMADITRGKVDVEYKMRFLK